MSRNNKNARLHAQAREWSKIRKSGGKGPDKTQATHGKERVLWKTKEVQEARSKVMQRNQPKTVLEQLKGASK